MYLVVYAVSTQDCTGNSNGCHWSHNEYRGVEYHIQTGVFDINLPTPRGAVLKLGMCADIQCGSSQSRGCISVPGVNPVSTGNVMCLVS